jgi:hypothetical protein
MTKVKVESMVRSIAHRAPQIHAPIDDLSNDANANARRRAL